MEPSLQPSFTFPSRYELANQATGLRGILDQSYVHSVPRRATDISIETGLNTANVIVPTGRLQTLDPQGVLPIPRNIYVQPGAAEGLSNESLRDNAETRIMETLSSNNALKRGNYQAAEQVMGRGATIEEIQNQTTVPNKRASQLGGPDIHVGQRSQHVGAPVRNGPNYQSMSHTLSTLGTQIDELAKEYSIPKDQVARLKTRYNLFTPADPNGKPNLPVNWTHMWELLKRDAEALRTNTDNIRKIGPGADNARRQAEGGSIKHPELTSTDKAPKMRATYDALSSVVPQANAGFDQDEELERPAGNTTADFTGNNQVIAQEQAAESPQDVAATARFENLGPHREIDPSSNPVIQEYSIDEVPITHTHDVIAMLNEKNAIYNQYQQEISEAREHPSVEGGGLHGRSDKEFLRKPLPQTWSTKAQLQDPVSYSVPQQPLARKADYVLLEGPRDYSRDYTMDAHTYQPNRYHAAPLSQQLMTRTGHDAVPISGQIQTAASHNHGLFETNVRQFAREPFRTEELRNVFMPQPPPEDMTAINPRSNDPHYMRYDNTIPQGTGRQGGPLTRRPFGKHFINLDKLFHHGELSLSYANGKKVSRVKNMRVARGSGLHQAICAIATGKKPTKKLTPEERGRLHMICQKSQVDHPLVEAGAVNVDPLQQLHIAMGEINAGNDSPALRMQIRRLLKELEATGKLSRDHISSIKTAYL